MTGVIALGLYGSPLVRLLGCMVRRSRLRGGLPCGLGPLRGGRVLIGSAVRSRCGLLRIALLPRLTLAHGLARARLRRIRLPWARRGLSVAVHGARLFLLWGGKGVVAFGHEQGGKPPALP